MGSGKSTLATGLSHARHLSLLPENPNAIQYLPDLRGNPSRWAFETQLAFLSHKATSIAGFLSSRGGFIVDRTLDEDARIFAKYFFDKGEILPRAYKTYQTLADHFLTSLDHPDIIIYCDVDVATAQKRIASRGRPDSGLHTSEHLSEIRARYLEWIDTIRTSDVYKLDSLSLDWRDHKVIEAIARDLDLGSYFLDPEPHPQLDLFSPSPSPLAAPVFSVLSAVYQGSVREGIRRTPESDRSPSHFPYPSVYIAAPFTNVALKMPPAPAADPQLFAMEALHGEIPRGPYRRALTKLANGLQKMGLHPILPHRDVNRWGERLLRPEDVVRMCTHHVLAADIFVGLLGLSHGSHYEFGVARGAGKPCVIFHSNDLSDSFIAQGVSRDSPRLMVIPIDSLSELESAVEGSAFREFVGSYCGGLQ